MKLKINYFTKNELILELIRFACDYLDIQPRSIEVDVLEVTGHRGMCIDLDTDSFLILIKNYEGQLETLAHELVHVKQYMKQDLGSLLGTEEYETSWWEQEARSLSKHIMEKFNERNDFERQ